MLKVCWRICQVEGRHVKFKQFFMACKRCFLILFAHRSLPVARFQIQSGKVSTPGQLIKTVVYSWQGSTTLFSAIIESTVINTKSDATVFFLNQNDSTGPRRLRCANNTFMQHIINKLIYFLFCFVDIL